MPRYQLNTRCLFVDAFRSKDPENDDHDPAEKKPVDLPCAHVMHVKNDHGNHDSAEYVSLNDTAAFITRFIVLRVDTDTVLPKIVESEYGLAPADAAAEVGKVVDMLKPKYIHEIPKKTYHRKHEPPGPDPSFPGGKHKGKYDLDFRTNFLGVSFMKGPL
jgi:hypothetical protein